MWPAVVGPLVALALLGVPTTPLATAPVSGGTSGASAMPDAPPLSAAARPWPADPEVGLHIPWAAGGLHLDAHGNRTDAPEPWPDQPVEHLRLWDTRTTWTDLEPERGRFDFTHLDAHLAAAEQHGVTDVVLVLAGTPSWAARDPQAQGAGWLTPGSASPPRRLADWRRYVDAVVEHYRGRVNSYQIGNEPNTSIFWQGTRRDLRRLVSTAATEIHRLDPSAKVIAPGPLVVDPADAVPAALWWKALRGTGVDALALQWYPRRGTDPTELIDVVSAMRHVVAKTDLADLPIWLTEVNHQRPTGRGKRTQMSLVRDTMSAARTSGIARVYWYAWTAIGPRTLLPLQRGSPAARELARYGAQTA